MNPKQIKSRIIEVTLDLIDSPEVLEEVDKDIFLDTPLMDIGIDSLAVLELVVTLEREYGVRLSEEELVEITCLQDILKLLLNKQAG
ncbi:acyl carrier protein [Paenibacillus lutrae]|uniref:Acyl carrier protein n=1 Tax=Paenibacillus lutrae TaxID=2078573 RepID=A0A7X3FFT6_9BACL|nr:acyl carrier protein [Paenibacillus lutrae]MVO98887.1 acyl carrier protein [Paenibacillus lutrae]